MQISYRAAPVPVRPAFAGAHDRFWQRLARPGAWWTAAERIAIANETRNAVSCPLCARRRLALAPGTVAGQHAVATSLPAPAIDAIHRLVTDQSRLGRRWFDAVLAAGLGAGHYVELLGTVASVLSIDSFCRALGLPPHPLPSPVAGAPSGYRPARLEVDQAWIEMVPADNAGTAEADLWSALRPTGYVVRALSLVPDEVRTLADGSAAHYLPLAEVGNPRARLDALDRQQIELIAARVSALNQCFY